MLPARRLFSAPEAHTLFYLIGGTTVSLCSAELDNFIQEAANRYVKDLKKKSPKQGLHKDPADS